MNDKYLICTIKNDGNNEIMTSILKLNVNEPKKEEDIEVTIPEDEINKPTEEHKLNNDFKNKLLIIFASIMGVSLVGIILNLLSRKKRSVIFLFILQYSILYLYQCKK